MYPKPSRQSQSIKAAPPTPSPPPTSTPTPRSPSAPSPKAPSAPSPSTSPTTPAAGGQRVKLTLAGSAADKLTLLDHADEVALGPDGAFTLVVPEGRKELSFGLWAKEDIDAGTLELEA